jgi:HAMP domain.
MLRRVYLVKPRLQIKYLIIALVVVVVTSIAMYYVFWSSLVRAPGIDQMSGGELHALERAYQTAFVWLVALLAAAVAIESIFLFHKLIGPIFIFERALRKLADGDLSAQVHVRKNDELKEMAADIQRLIDNTRNAALSDRQKIEEIRKKLDQNDVAGAKALLAEINQWYKLGS